MNFNLRGAIAPMHDLSKPMATTLLQQSPPPVIGQDTQAVLSAAGFSTIEIESLLKAGII